MTADLVNLIANRQSILQSDLSVCERAFKEMLISRRILRNILFNCFHGNYGARVSKNRIRIDITARMKSIGKLDTRRQPESKFGFYNKPASSVELEDLMKNVTTLSYLVVATNNRSLTMLKKLEDVEISKKCILVQELLNIRLPRYVLSKFNLYSSLYLLQF